MTSLRLIRAVSLQRSRWKNGGGWTTQIARDTGYGHGEEFRWRISIADIEHDGPFSAFPGVGRDLLLLDGNGLELDIGASPPVRLDRRYARAHFDGGAAVNCRLLAGPTRDFNVMVQRDEVQADVFARPLVGSMVLFAEPGVEWITHVATGHAQVRSGADAVKGAQGDTIHVDFRDTSPDRVIIDGGGELILVKLKAGGLQQPSTPA